MSNEPEGQDRLDYYEGNGVLDAYEGREPKDTTGWRSSDSYAYMLGYWREAALEFKAAAARNGELYHMALDRLDPVTRLEVMAQAVGRE